ncbi:MAG: hypothetical protein JNL13_10445, partial [Chitinophagaceae bacterium]|nr:hypothetical protein [Chitinophagaceae bacterium]
WAPQTFYNTSNGLINNRTGTVAQDKAGYMWVGTDNGICCYDGRKFTFFPGRNRRFYFAHSYATFYKQYAVLGTSGEGVALCHRNKVLFRRFKGCEQVYIIAAVALSDHSFLLATTQKNGILLVRDSVASPVKLPEAFLARITACLIVDKDSKGNIWVGTDSGLLVFPKGDLNKPFVLRGMQGKYINVLKEGRNGVMYAGAATSLYSISDTSYTPLSECRLLCRKDSASISSLETDKDHNIYIGYSYNYNNTLIRLSPDGKQTSLLLDNTNYPWDLRFDREENLWAACENGLLKISQPYIKNYLAEAGNFPIAKSGIILNDGSFLGNIGDKVYQISAERAITRKCRGKIHAGYLEQRFSRRLTAKSG